MRFLSSAQFIERSEVADEFVAPSAALANRLLAGKGLGRLPPCSVSYFVEELHRPGAAIGLHTRGTANIDTGGEFIPQWSCDFLKGCEPRAAGRSGWNAVHPVCDPHQVDGGGADDVLQVGFGKPDVATAS